MLSSPSRCVRALAGLAGAALLSGCFRYVPVELGAVPPDSEVRVHVSRRGLADIPEEIPTGATFVQGRFVRETTDSVLVQVAVGRRLDQPGALDLRQNVLLPRSEIVEVELRELSRPRTVLSIAGGAALAAVLVGIVIEAGGESVDDGGEGPDQLRGSRFAAPAR